MKLSQILIWSGVFMAVTGTATIDSELQQAYDDGGYGSTENVMITFEGDHLEVIEQINEQNFSLIHEKRSALTKAQQEFANEVQEELQNFLRSINVQHQTFWINNKMYVPNVGSDLVQVIANFPGVAKIEKELVIQMDPTEDGEPEDFGNVTMRPESVEWGIVRVRAPKVWNKGYKGKGIVVANIDSGVRYTHEALKGRWRKKSGWFDPYKQTKLPSDDGGHGTHVMGTITGSRGIGVAPQSTWIACKGCSGRKCSESALLHCGEWIQCPTNHLGLNANCKLAPDLVCNSWGGGQGDKHYDGVIASWQAAGIIPIFAMGNTGPKCGTAESPGDRDKVIAVGNIDKNNRVSRTSSRGPTKDGKMKPDISAPGENIRSACFTSDTAYCPKSGTSMAAPHVSGVTALMLQKNRHLSYAKIYRAITTTAVRKGLDQTSIPSKCGRASNSKFPNNVYGYGRIDALNAINAIKKM